MHVWEIYACWRKRVLSKPTVSQKQCGMDSSKWHITKQGTAMDSNTSHQSRGLEWRRKQYIKEGTSHWLNSISSFSGSSCGSTIVLPVSPWTPGALELMVMCLWYVPGHLQKSVMKMGVKGVWTLEAWIWSPSIFQANHPFTCKRMPHGEDRWWSVYLFWLILLFEKRKFSILGPCKGIYCIFWIVRAGRAILKQNAHGYCLWRLYIHAEWEGEQKGHQTLCDDVVKDRYETSVKTPLRLSPYIMYGNI